MTRHWPRILFRQVLRHARRHKLLAALNVLSVALGVCVFLAITIANHSASRFHSLLLLPPFLSPLRAALLLLPFPLILLLHLLCSSRPSSLPCYLLIQVKLL